MELLENKILQCGRVLAGDVLKVDSFINHQIETDLMLAMGRDFFERFREKNITKILTLEVSGIAIAMAAAFYFNVPVVFAKKTESLTLSSEAYSSTVDSYTKNKTYTIRVDKNYISADDTLLIIDDFLAKGQALHGLLDLAQQAGARVAGIGIAIEKAFQEGGNALRQQGYDVYSQARIKAFTDGEVVFERD